ncbi:unnamed protein product [Acanthoscelides obtectus]|uniref:Uncharacterized protein n=1 Tax=Acanthoscelides obtectus TaxID=200917 RepID=A0A9P0P7C1_ACAOB|nr:unnamed protein product [Acanthoscelides obtectus]CAK1656429.1 hypothetical protein AOBTE_LOCUS19704 [Acanthoscelides obtectus]
MDQQSDVNTNDMSSEGPQHQEPMLTMAETQDVRARKKYSSGDNSGAAHNLFLL